MPNFTLLFKLSRKLMINQSLKTYYSGQKNIPLNNTVHRVLDGRRGAHGVSVKACYTLEECQNLIPNSALRTYSFQEISRFITQGRNFGLSYIASTQRLASVDSNLVEISGLKFFGKTEGDNNRRKAKVWLPKEFLEKAKDLRTGEFLQQYGSKVSLERISLFQSQTKPQPYIEPKLKKQTLLHKVINAVKGD